MSQSDLSVDFAGIENIFEPPSDNFKGRNIAIRDVGAIDIADQILLPNPVLSHSDSTPTQSYISVVLPSNHDIQEERKSDQMHFVTGHAEHSVTESKILVVDDDFYSSYVVSATIQ